MRYREDALVNLAQSHAYTLQDKKQVLVQEGDGYIKDLLTPVISNLGLLLLKRQRSGHLYLAVNKCCSI